MVSNLPEHLSRCSCFLAALMFATPLLRADDPPTAQPGYRTIALRQGDKTAYIQVKDASDPYRNVKDSGDSSPDHFSFSKTSTMAAQKYDLGDTASSHDNADYQKSVEHTFLTKSYFDHSADGADKSTPGLHTTVPLGAAEGYSARAAGFDKGFLTANADLGQAKVAGEANTPSSYQDQTAVIGGHDVKTFASSMSSKTFQGREADAIKHDLTQMNEGLLGMKDLPNRALTIDEVRELINHGVKPETDEKPPEPGKPLNDPDYMPDPAPAPLHAQPGDDHHLSDDNDIIPPPGMMAHPQGVTPPEDSEPLPQ